MGSIPTPGTRQGDDGALARIAGRSSVPLPPVVRRLAALHALLPLLVPLVPQLVPMRPLAAQDDRARVSIIYTGRGLGALGVRRSQDEHELLTEQAVAEQTPFKLVSHPAWRAPGIVVFLSAEAPQGGELEEAIARRAEAEALEGVPALASATVLLLQDPWRPMPDLLAMLERNPRRAEYGDLVPTRVRVSRLRSAGGDRIVIVEQLGAYWPEDPGAWSVGEMNRVDIGDSRVFELPFNLGGLGARASLVRDERAEAVARSITVDLGHQDGDVGMPRPQRARIDYTALREMGYAYVVPFDFELALGAEALGALVREFPDVPLLAANVRSADSTLFLKRAMLSTADARIGLVGLVNATIRDRLPRHVLGGYTFEPPVAAARREVAALRAAGATAIVVLSNMDPADNAVVAQDVPGIDAIVADLPGRAIPENTRLRVELPDRPFVRPGTPAVVARSAGNGLAVGRLDLEFRTRRGSAVTYLAALEHRVRPITDRILPDTALVRRVTGLAALAQRPRGPLLFPAFPDLVERHPEVGGFDEVTRRGRVSKAMWEAFMARRLRVQGNAEVAVIRRLDQFQPLIGKLHENEVGSWLWTEDEIVLVDLPGADLKALLRADARGELASSGIDLAGNAVLGHRIDDAAYYRVATSDVLFEGGRARYFARALRVRREFAADPLTGALAAVPGGQRVALREFILGELERARAAGGEAQLDRLATMLRPDPRHVDLLSVDFERPTIWASLNQVRGNDGYSSVPESRVRALDSWVIGASGRVVVTQERRRSATDLGLSLAFAQQHVADDGRTETIESADDIKLDVTLRASRSSEAGRKVLPFIRGLYDTEFTPTVNASGVENPQQRSARLVGGLSLQPGTRLRRGDLGVVLENDFGRPNPQQGLQARADFERPVGAPSATPMTYRLRNDLTYFFPAPKDAAGDLALRYNMVHELLVPIASELSLSIAADLFFFQGKVEATRTPGVSALLRVGLTYDRLWKPRYQPFF